MAAGFDRERAADLAVQGVYAGTSDSFTMAGDTSGAGSSRSRDSKRIAWRNAVKTFEPYDRVKEENPEASEATKALIAEGKKAGTARKTFVFVNNRLEGNALTTIAAVIERSGG